MKVCILAAGLGSRLGSFSENIPKALLPLGNKAVLSHIFDQFSKDHHFVIAIGHQGEKIKNFVSIVHGDLEVDYVSVDPYQGPGSGPGFSLFSCKNILQEPFYFTACDTLIEKPLPVIDANWIGVSEESDPANWCTALVSKDGDVKDLYYKDPNSPTHTAFTGVAFIKDFKPFWDGLTEPKESAGEIQVNLGLARVINFSTLKAIEIPWVDTGNIDTYAQALKKYEQNLTFYGKSTEITYRYGKRIVKFFNSPKGAQVRFERYKMNPAVFPKNVNYSGQFLIYDYSEGSILSSQLTGEKCANFLDWAKKNLWKKQDIKDEGTFNKLIVNFYIDKTKDRLRLFYQKNKSLADAKNTNINDVSCKPILDLLDQALPILIEHNLSVFFHGDLHGDNIIESSTGEYILIDWRDFFGSETGFGDIYYDLAKFLHTLDLSVEVMDKKDFRIIRTKNSYYLNHRSSFLDNDARQAFYSFISKNGFSQKKIDILNGIVLINMSPLYEEELGKYLYYLGWFMIQKALENK